MARPSDEVLQDGVLAIAAALVGVASLYSTDPSVSYDYPPPNAGLVLLALLATVPLAWRRVAPLPALAVSLLSVVTIMCLRWYEGVLPFATVVLLYSVAVHRPLRSALAGLAGTLGAFAVLGLLGAPFFDSPAAIFSSLVFCLPWSIGLAVRRHEQRRGEAVARALEAERELAVVQERAAAAERLRIARELHDVVAHTLSVVIVQASVARHLLPDDPGRAAPALGAIEESSRRALDDLRLMLGVLRNGVSPADPPPPVPPPPGLREIEDLLTLHRATGAHTESRIDGAVDRLPESVRLTLHRIVQEALTNAGRHAAGGAVRVDVGLRGRDVIVRVENQPGTPSGTTGAGLGLVGMAERVAAFGGRLTTGPSGDGGFLVEVVLPVGAPSVTGASR